MKRRIGQIEKSQFDVLIIGGGILGACLAKEISGRGKRTVLIDKGDFCNATSANSLKILHGGLRYLQQLDFRRMRESITSRNEMMRFAPHLTRPLKCVMPLYGRGGLRSREIVQSALWLNDLIGRDRNYGLDSDHLLPRGKVISKTAFSRCVPGMNIDGLRGGGVWYDAIVLNTERLCLEMLKAASDQGACIANYVGAKSILMDHGTLNGVVAMDEISHKSIEIKAKMTINASGPWMMDICDFIKPNPENAISWAKALNIVVKRPLTVDIAAGIENRTAFTDSGAASKKERRLFFFVPWRGRTMIGTWYRPFHSRMDDFEISQDDIGQFISEINNAFPAAKISLDDVCGFHGGILPAKRNSAQNPLNVQLLKKPLIVDHRKKDGVNGMMSVLGVKYTTAPMVAFDVANRLFPSSKAHFPGSKGGGTKRRTNGEGISNDVRMKTESESVKTHFQSRYGNGYEQPFRYFLKNLNDASLICEDPPVFTSEIKYFMEEEMALHLPDIIYRRTGIGTADRPAEEVVVKVSSLMADRLNWDDEKQKKEIENVYKKFVPLTQRSRS